MSDNHQFDSVIISERKIGDKENDFTFQARLLDEGMDEVSKCIISVGDDTWRIAAWYTSEELSGKGFGTKCMSALVQYLSLRFGQPGMVEYVWNGQNEYVYDWMARHFSPVSKCPIAVQKYQTEDDWDSHIYKLDVPSFLEYFGKDADRESPEEESYLDR